MLGLDCEVVQVFGQCGCIKPFDVEGTFPFGGHDAEVLWAAGSLKEVHHRLNIGVSCVDAVTLTQPIQNEDFQSVHESKYS